MERHQHAVVQILSHLGQVWVYASPKPALLKTSMMAFGRERLTFVDEMISIASYCFQMFFSCQHRTTGVLCDFWGSFGHFYALTEFSMHFMCIIKIWTTCTCSGAYKLVEIKFVSLGAWLDPMQEMGMNFKHRGTVYCRQNIETPGF